MEKKGQANLNAMGIITLAIAIIIGAFIVGNVYNGFVGSGAATTQTAAIETTLNSTLDNSMTGFTLLAVAVIVGAATFILAVMGSR